MKNLLIILLAVCSCTLAGAQEVTHEYVDLGLPSGVKWATTNIGAENPWEYGDYFAWGETEPYYKSLEPTVWKDGKKEGYQWTSYKWCCGTENSLTKYCNQGKYGKDNFTDDITILLPSDDAASANWKGDWRMPTLAEMKELIDKCVWTWETVNGIKGRKVTSRVNGNSIFLPSAGHRTNDRLTDDGWAGYYLSASLGTNYPTCVGSMYFNSGSFYKTNSPRNEGYSIRPVLP